MSNKIELIGLAELRRALQQLPTELVEDASAIVMQHAHDAERETVRDYPSRTGRLRAGVSTQQGQSRLFAAAILRSTAKHASLYERGTGRRETSKGANRGVMPAARRERQMVPAAIRARQQMMAALIALVRRAGFEVSV